jgi:RNA polymerase sigma factor for flagellar operon FliA
VKYFDPANVEVLFVSLHKPPGEYQCVGCRTEMAMRDGYGVTVECINTKLEKIMELPDREERLQEYVPLVKRLAYCLKQWLPDNIEIDDLIQVGMMGLMEADSRYDEMQGVQFSTYAMKRIRGSMLDELRHDDWASQGLRRNIRRCDAAIMKLQHLLGRSPGEIEIANELEMSLSLFQKLRFESEGLQQVHYDTLQEDSEADFLDRHKSDSNANPLDLLQEMHFSMALADAIGRLSIRERTLMEMRYNQDMNLREIGEAMGVKESRACQIFNQTVKFLRAALREYLFDQSGEINYRIHSVMH